MNKYFYNIKTHFLFVYSPSLLILIKSNYILIRVSKLVFFSVQNKNTNQNKASQFVLLLRIHFFFNLILIEIFFFYILWDSPIFQPIKYEKRIEATPTKKYSTTAPPEPTTPYEKRTSAKPMTTKLKATTGPTSTPQRNKQRQS